jgi:hypothetical protein
LATAHRVCGEAGKAESEGWCEAMKLTVVYDGPSRPILMSDHPPRMFSISEFVDGRWQTFDGEDALCELIAASISARRSCGEECSCGPTLPELERKNLGTAGGEKCCRQKGF